MSSNNIKDVGGAVSNGGFGFILDNTPLNEKVVETAFDGLTEEPKSLEELLLVVIDKIDALDRKLELVFGNHVVIRGKFTDVGDINES